jgi:hypothetical protein
MVWNNEVTVVNDPHRDERLALAALRQSAPPAPVSSRQLAASRIW